MPKAYYVEITDTYGGEPNYSWVTRCRVRAASVRGAVIRVNRDSGLGFRRAYDLGDCVRYDSRSGATCAFVSPWDDAEHGNYLHVNVL